MEELLKPVSSTKAQNKTTISASITSPAPKRNIKDIDDVILVLRDSPSSIELKTAVDILRTEGEKHHDAKVSQAANVLVTEIIPDWWDNIKLDLDLKSLRKSLVEYLRDVACLSRLVSRIKLLTSEARKSSGASQSSSLSILIDVLENVLQGDNVVLRLYSKCLNASSRPQQEIRWKETTSVLSSGRVIAVVAEAEDVIAPDAKSRGSSWIGQGLMYAQWLAGNLSAALINGTQEGIFAASLPSLAAMLGKSLMLGYQDILITTFLDSLPVHNQSNLSKFVELVKIMPAYQQRTILLGVLDYINARYIAAALPDEQTQIVGNAAALVKTITDDNQNLLDCVVDLCTNVEKSVLTRSQSLRRLATAVLSDDEDRLTSLLEKMQTKFGDQLFIRHATVSQQEALAQLILLTAGYIHRKQPMMLFAFAKSSIQTHGMSNRLKASSQRAQWLGMIVGMGLSGLADKTGSKLVFDDESMHTSEAQWYLSLVNVQDKIGSVENLRVKSSQQVAQLPIRKAGRVSDQRLNAKNAAIPRSSNPSAGQQISRIIEIESGEDDDDDVIPYAKPDSDPEDSDEDPTLVNRDKPKAPVYIRDLLAGLREAEKYDRHRLALETAPGLIRRKATFGKEVSDHADELLAVLMNMNDTFEMEDFLELRQDALIAVVIAQPGIIAPAIAVSVFQGSFSVQQRAAMLTALALGAREIAGHKDEDRDTTPNFPSRELPKHLQQIYGEQKASRLESASSKLEEAMVQSLALSAADQLTGPNALKVRTFSSRMEVEKKNKTKVTRNALAKNVAEWFLLPLINGWWTQKQSLGSGAVTFSKHLLPLYLRTLAVLLHAAGPSTLTLPQLTTEVWDILLSVRINALHSNDVRTLDALLFAFLTLLELNEDKQRLANEHAKELVETQEWAKLVLDQYGSESGPDESEAGKVKMLAAAVVVRCHEVVERWQRVMMGNMMDF